MGWGCKMVGGCSVNCDSLRFALKLLGWENNLKFSKTDEYKHLRGINKENLSELKMLSKPFSQSQARTYLLLQAGNTHLGYNGGFQGERVRKNLQLWACAR